MHRRRNRKAQLSLAAYGAERLEARLLLSNVSLSIPTGMPTPQGGVLAVPILAYELNDFSGDSGLSQASICVNYNSSKFSTNASDVYEGTAEQETASLVGVSATSTSGQLDISISANSFAIASVVGTGGNIVVTTQSALPKGMNFLDFVQISGVSNFTAANGVFNISVKGTNSFTLAGTSGDVGSATPDTGTWTPVISGGTPDDQPGAYNDSLAVIDFNVLTNAATGTANINLVSSNSLGTTFLAAADGNNYSLSMSNGSADILAESETTNLGYFSPVSALSLGGSPGIGTMTLLDNGDVLAQGGNNNASNEWFELVPDGSGNYTDGAWYQVANSNVGRLYYGSALLPNGQVLVVGGEDTNSKGVSETNTGEIFTPPSTLPGTGSWTPITPFPKSQFGDNNLEVMSDGTV